MSEGAIRVLAVCPGDGEGSSMIFVRRQVDSLIQLGVEVDLVYLDVPLNPVSWFRRWVEISALAEESRADIVHSHYGTATALLCVLAARMPVVVTFRGSDLNPSPAVSKLRSILGRVLSQVAAMQADGVVCVSRQLAGRILARPRRIMVLPDAVDTELFRPRPRDEARAALGIDPDVPLVLFNSGRDPWVKRRDLAIAAMERVRQSIANVQLIELDGSHDPSSIPALMSACDCLILTSRHEGSPNVIKEALAVDLPIVSVDVGDVAERIQGISHCYIVPSDAGEIAVGVVRVLRDRERSNGRAAACQVSREVIARGVVSMYRSVLE